MMDRKNLELVRTGTIPPKPPEPPQPSSWKATVGNRTEPGETGRIKIGNDVHQAVNQTNCPAKLGDLCVAFKDENDDYFYTICVCCDGTEDDCCDLSFEFCVCDQPPVIVRTKQGSATVDVSSCCPNCTSASFAIALECDDVTGEVTGSWTFTCDGAETTGTFDATKLKALCDDTLDVISEFMIEAPSCTIRVLASNYMAECDDDCDSCVILTGPSPLQTFSGTEFSVELTCDNLTPCAPFNPYVTFKIKTTVTSLVQTTDVNAGTVFRIPGNTVGTQSQWRLISYTGGPPNIESGIDQLTFREGFQQPLEEHEYEVVVKLRKKEGLANASPLHSFSVNAGEPGPPAIMNFTVTETPCP